MRTLPLLALLTGCLGGGGPLEGVWMIEATNPELSCTSSTSSNLREAVTPDDPGEPGPWVDLSDRTESLDIFFVRISHGRSDDTVMLVDDRIIPGTQLDKETWEFEYVAEITDVDGEEHEDGYLTRETDTTQVTHRYQLKRVGNRYLEGDVTFDTENTTLYEETDQWNVDHIGIFSGDLPSGIVGAPFNEPEVDDCTDSICQVRTSFDCKNDAAFVGTFTGLVGESTFDVEDNSSTPGF